MSLLEAGDCMTDFMFSNPPEKPPEPDETPFSDLFGVSHTKTWKPLIKSCMRLVSDLEQERTLTTREASSRASYPSFFNSEGHGEVYFWTRVCPTLESHPNVRWNDCWKLDPERALSDDEWKDVASEFNIQKNHKDDPRRYYPRIIKGMYQTVRNTYESNDPRHGVSALELERNTMHIQRRHLKKCVNYLQEFPDIVPPSAVDDRPDWVYDESTTNDS